MSGWIDRRRSAVLLHITSLPGPFHKGVLGEEARCFVDDLIRGGFSVWQFLPLGPTHGHGSPYESLSTFAGNPELIDLRDCVDQGWLAASDLSDFVLSAFDLSTSDLSASDRSGDCANAEQHKAWRMQAADQFWSAVQNDVELQQAIEAFQAKHAYWLDDFALFSALKSATGDHAWWQWSDALRDRHVDALQQARDEHAGLIQLVVFEQFLFDRQWHALKAYAESRGVQLFGDLPIYVAHDSSDVWAGREYFTVNAKGLCEDVAGVPPDYFSETGQRWGNPLYRWDKMQADGFKWWIARVARQLEWVDMLRIDHFRALEAFWAIPGESEDGIIGEWRPAPGEAMLQALQDALGELPLIAEDLGIITDEVTALREAFALPGMKILQFAFGGDADNPYLPGNFSADAVVYTGTHDNDTTKGWFDAAEQHVREHVLKVLKVKAEQMPWALIESALASDAELAVIPMQDLLALGSEAKFNTPGTLENNWSWRMAKLSQQDAECWNRSATLNKASQRTFSIESVTMPSDD